MVGVGLETVKQIESQLHAAQLRRASSRLVRTASLRRGPPGSGQGHQAEFIADHFGDPEDLDRRHLPGQRRQGHRPGQAGQEVHGRRRPGPGRGHQSRWSATGSASPTLGRGFLLDGFPRNVPQADELDGMLSDLGTQLDVVLELDRRRRRGRSAAVGPAHLQAVRPHLARRVRPADSRGDLRHLRRRALSTATTTRRERCGTASRSTRSQTAPLISFYATRGQSDRHRRARTGRGRHRAGASPRCAVRPLSLSMAGPADADERGRMRAESGSSSSPSSRSRLMREAGLVVARRCGPRCARPSSPGVAPPIWTQIGRDA